jgi:DNA-binding response OmpR family regulator
MAAMKKYSILIADDDRQLVEMLRSRLEFEGYKTWAAYEGVEAIDVALKKKLDLILLDLWMPAGTGVTVLEKLRAHKGTKDVPVIVLTALEKPNLEKEIKEAGAQDLVHKPYDMKLLMGKIRHLLPQTGNEK